MGNDYSSISDEFNTLDRRPWRLSRLFNTLHAYLYVLFFVQGLLQYGTTRLAAVVQEYTSTVRVLVQAGRLLSG